MLRNLVIDDAPAVWAYKSMPEAVRFQSWRPSSLDEVQEFIIDMEAVEINFPGSWFQLAICRKDTGIVIGDIGIHFHATDGTLAEIGYTVSPAHQGNGFATEAARAVLGYLFNTLNKRRVTASIDPRNAPSAAVLMKLGFQKEAHFRKSYFMDGEWTDDCVYGLMKEEWIP